MGEHTDYRAPQHVAIPISIIDQTAVVDKPAPCPEGGSRHLAP
jgi:hypothetical protein